MIQHPIPQNVTSYQFRLIGDMTIKQFVLLSSGIGVAVALYYSNLFFPIKWFLLLLSAVSGFAAAFVPYEERPLDQWLLNYVRAIYRPTYFMWKKQPTLPDYFTHTSAVSPQAIADTLEVSRVAAIRRQQGLSSYLTTLPQDSNNDLDNQERAAIHNFTSLFQLDEAALSVAAKDFAPLPPEEEVAKSAGHAFASISVPQNIPAQVTTEAAAGQDRVSLNPTPSPAAGAHISSTTLTPQTSDAVTAATTSTNLPFPSIPSAPNVLVGMVIDADNNIIPNAIVEVLDDMGLPARATKTNQLGQFFSTTPLKRGTYRINIDKEGLLFDTIELRLTGQIVEPLKIQAKPAQAPSTNH